LSASTRASHDISLNWRPPTVTATLCRRRRFARLKSKIEKLKEEIVRLNAINAEMMRSKDKQISLTDPDARSMATSGAAPVASGWGAFAGCGSRPLESAALPRRTPRTDIVWVRCIADLPSSDIALARVC
jgi:hypothetical protein